MSEKSAFSHEFHIWLTPITTNEPCGVDLSLEAEFESIKEEVDKDVSIYADQMTDWARVLADSTSFLENKSKDLWVLCYGVKAVYELRGLAETARAISAACEFLKKFWPDFHPSLKRPARRVAPLAWLCARLETIIMAEGFPGDQGQAAAELKQSIIRLSDLMKERLPEAETITASLIRQLPDLARPDEKTDEALQAADSQDEATLPAAAPPPTPPAVQVPVSAREVPSDGPIPPQLLPQVFRGLQDQGRRVAQHYLYHNPTDWRGYFLHRAVLWPSVTQEPQADEAGVTQLRPVPSDKARTYQASVDAGHFSDVLPGLEKSASKMAFWFDGHYLVARCLEALRAFEALAVLKSSLAAFIHQFPGLLRLKYFDSAPFASPATLSWLESLSSGGSDASPVKLRSDTDDNEEDLLCEAMAAFNDHGFEAGLAQLGHMPAARNRASIRHGLITARYCLTAGQPGAGVTLLQELYSRLEEWNMLDWEPDLTADILSLMIIAAGRQGLTLNEAQMRRLYWLRLPSALATFKE
ncbi:type VI secretion system protein TssA [Deltaproteobacteria bacterium Smac51]|nr:type VI secretion system protein TssA [Deltaproteobacteria bacterium Smac51]